MNSQMRELLGDRKLVDLQAVIPDDHGQWVIEAGWVIGPSGALLLRARWAGGRDVLDDPRMVADYEYEVNDEHLLLDDLADDMNTYLLNAASRGLLFAAQMLQDAARLPNSDQLEAVVSVHVDTYHEDFLLQGANIRFLTRRGGYPDWLGNLESFRHEAIAIVDRTDVTGLNVDLQLK